MHIAGGWDNYYREMEKIPGWTRESQFLSLIKKRKRRDQDG